MDPKSYVIQHIPNPVLNITEISGDVPLHLTVCLVGHSIYIDYVLSGDVNSDNMADLVCVQPDGGVGTYQSLTTDTGIKFSSQPYEDKFFGFCPAKQDEKAKVYPHFIVTRNLLSII